MIKVGDRVKIVAVNSCFTDETGVVTDTQTESYTHEVTLDEYQRVNGELSKEFWFDEMELEKI